MELVAWLALHAALASKTRQCGSQAGGCLFVQGCRRDTQVGWVGGVCVSLCVFHCVGPLCVCFKTVGVCLGWAGRW